MFDLYWGFTSLCSSLARVSCWSLCDQEAQVLQAKHVAFCTHLLLAALLVTTLKLRTFLFLGLHTDTFFYSFVVDFCAGYLSLDLHEEAQFCVVDIRSFSHLHILSCLKYHGPSEFIRNAFNVDCIKKNKMQSLESQYIKNGMETVSTVIVLFIHQNSLRSVKKTSSSFISSINGSMSLNPCSLAEAPPIMLHADQPDWNR